MISLAKPLPLIQSGTCVFADYDETWIENVLNEAEQASGLTLAYKTDLAKGIIGSLKEQGELKAMPIELLFNRIRESLLDLGMHQIANQVKTQTPAVNIRLEHIALEAPIPLFFYSELNKRISRLRKAGVNRYLFSGVRHCCLILEQRKRICKATERSKRELEDFLKLSESVYAYRYSCRA